MTKGFRGWGGVFCYLVPNISLEDTHSFSLSPTHTHAFLLALLLQQNSKMQKIFPNYFKHLSCPREQLLLFQKGRECEWVVTVLVWKGSLRNPQPGCGGRSDTLQCSHEQHKNGKFQRDVPLLTQGLPPRFRPAWLDGMSPNHTRLGCGGWRSGGE